MPLRILQSDLLEKRISFALCLYKNRAACGIFISKWEKGHFTLEGGMAKIVEVDQQSGADSDEECYEIDPAEFAKKVNLKATDDVILVAAKGEIKLLEVVELEDSSRQSGGVVTHGSSRHDFAAGDSMDNPCEVEEDEPILLQMEIVEDRFALDKSPPPQLGPDDGNNWDERRTAAVTPYKIVVKAEPGAEDDEEGQFVDGDKDGAVDVVSEMGAKPSLPIDSNGVEVIPDSVALKCEPVDGDSAKCAEEDEDGFVLV